MLALMRLRILLGVTILQIVCLVALATLLAVAEILTAVGNVAAASAFRYVALGVGTVFLVGFVILVLWMATLLINEFLQASEGAGPVGTERPPTDLGLSEEQPEEE